MSQRENSILKALKIEEGEDSSFLFDLILLFLVGENKVAENFELV